MGLFSSIVLGLVPRFKKRKKKRKSKAVRAGGGGFAPTGDSPQTKVIVANLFGSGGKEITERIVGMISSESGYATYHFQKTLKQNLRLAMLERLLLASEEGGAWLKEENADLLIWGEMEDMGTVARLHFLMAGSAGDGQPGTFGMADTLDIPVPTPEGIEKIVRAVVLAVVLPIAKGARRSMADRLKKLPKEAMGVVEAAGDGIPKENLPNILAALGNAYATSFRYGDKKAVTNSIQNYEAADKLINVDDTPLQWALLQTHWAAALEADARVKKDIEIMESAVKRYHTVTEGLPREGNGYDWALAHVRHAMALYRLASMAPGKASTHLKAAASSFDEALSVYDRSTMPLKWAEIMNHYGVVQMALGGYGSGNAMLQQSISSFRKALEIRSKELTPLEWAQTVNNLGAACVALAKRTKEEILLEEAATCFEGAIEVFRQTQGQKKKAQVIAKNLGRVRQMLGPEAA